MLTSVDTKRSLEFPLFFVCFKLKFLHTAPLDFAKHASTPNVTLANGYSGTFMRKEYFKHEFLL